MKIIINEYVQNIPILTQLAFLLIAIVLLGALIYCLYKFIIAIIAHKDIQKMQMTITDQEDELLQLEREILDVGLFYHKMQPEQNVDNESISYKKITKRIIKLIDQYSNFKTQKKQIKLSINQVATIKKNIKAYGIAIIALVFSSSVVLSQWTLVSHMYKDEQTTIIEHIPFINGQVKPFDKTKQTYIYDESLTYETDSKKQDKIKKDAYTCKLIIKNNANESIARLTLSMNELKQEEILNRFYNFEQQFFAQDNNARSAEFNLIIAKKAITSIEDTSFDNAHILYLYFTNEQGQLFKKELLFVAAKDKTKQPLQDKISELGLLTDTKNAYGIVNGGTFAYVDDAWVLSENIDVLSQYKDKLALTSITTTTNNNVDTTKNN